jgi:hypothetical protein
VDRGGTARGARCAARSAGESATAAFTAGRRTADQGPSIAGADAASQRSAEDGVRLNIGKTAGLFRDRVALALVLRAGSGAAQTGVLATAAMVGVVIAALGRTSAAEVFAQRAEITVVA